MTKSHIPAENAPPRVEIPTRPTASFEPIQRQKRGRPIGPKNANLRKKKVANDNLSLLAPPEDNCIMQQSWEYGTTKSYCPGK